MAFLLGLQDVEKLSGTFQSFCVQTIVKKMRNPFEMAAFSPVAIGASLR
jgi:hypothetical protein